MKITKLDAATCQVKTAIWLYFQDRDPISVHTLVTAAGEIIDMLCRRKGLVSMHQNLMDSIVPERRKEVADALNKARNFFKHASSRSASKDVMQDFSDESNLFAILFAVDGLRLLGASLSETRMFGAWVGIVEPTLLLNPPPRDLVEKVFGDIGSQSRAEQKRCALDALHLERDGKHPKA